MGDPCAILARRRRLISSAATVLTLVIAGTAVAAIAATAQISSGWSQVQGDAAHTGYVADSAAPPFKEGWHLTVPLGGPASTFGLSAPVVEGSSVIAVGPDSIVAADLTTGEQLWSVDRDFGPSATPAIAVTGKRRLLIYTEGFGPARLGTSGTPLTAAPTTSPSPSTSGSEAFDSHVTALDLATQAPAWTTPLPLKKVSRTGVTVDGNTAFVGDHDGNVYAIDVATGVLRWTAHAGGFLTNSLAVSGGEVVAAVQGGRTVRPHLIAFKESDGSTSWNVEVQGGAVLASSPAIADGHVVIGFSDQTVRSFELTDGSENWTARLNSPVFFTGAPAITPDAVLVVDVSGEVYRLDLATGARAWDFALNETVIRSPVVVAGDRVLIASSTGHLSAIDLASGRLVWRSERPAGILRSLTPTSAAVIAVRGGGQPGLVAFVEDPDGRLVSVVSPTELDLSKLLLAFAAAAVPLSLLLVIGGRAALQRMGPAFLDDDEGDGDPMVEDDVDDEGGA